MKKLVLVAALMVASFSFANEKTKEIVVENNTQTVSVETQQTETVFLTIDELLRYCWTNTYIYMAYRSIRMGNGWAA
jgi:hypothetical protein